MHADLSSLGAHKILQETLCLKSILLSLSLSPQGSTVITVSATDGDPSVSNQVAFTIEDGMYYSD